MITDARAQVDLIAALHLEAFFKMGHLENTGDQSNWIKRSVTAIPQSTQSTTSLDRHSDLSGTCLPEA